MGKETSIVCVVKTTIFGTRNAWSLTLDRDGETGKEVEVSLQIQGKTAWGFHLVMSPEGYVTADYHYRSLEEAKADARELFGAEAGDWASP